MKSSASWAGILVEHDPDGEAGPQERGPPDTAHSCRREQHGDGGAPNQDRRFGAGHDLNRNDPHPRGEWWVTSRQLRRPLEGTRRPGQDRFVNYWWQKARSFGRVGVNLYLAAVGLTAALCILDYVLKSMMLIGQARSTPGARPPVVNPILPIADFAVNKIALSLFVAGIAPALGLLFRRGANLIARGLAPSGLDAVVLGGVAGMVAGGIVGAFAQFVFTLTLQVGMAAFISSVWPEPLRLVGSVLPALAKLRHKFRRGADRRGRGGRQGDADPAQNGRLKTGAATTGQTLMSRHPLPTPPGSLDATIPAAIDVKPGSSSNPINLAREGLIPVALFGADNFDVTQVDLSTVRFAGATVYKSALQDVNGDGKLDLMLQFRTQDTKLRAGRRSCAPHRCAPNRSRTRCQPL
jgi:hypothetical protein